MGNIRGRPAAAGNPVIDAGSETRSRLIDVAERLFAEHGIEAVSLRTVGAHAGQRNNSVTQYHFGSKEGLIAAIIAARSSSIDARRHLLAAEQQQASGRPVTLSSLLRLLVVPLAETIDASRGETHYLRFLANVMDQPESVRDLESSETDQPALRYMRKELRALLPQLSASTFRRRSLWASLIAFRLLAQHERELVTTPKKAAPTDQVVRELIAMLVALYSAPGA